MTSQLRAWADYPLLIAVEPGGKMRRRNTWLRLPAASCYRRYPRAPSTGEDTTRYYSARLAREVAEVGINVNLAPVVDVLNHDCPRWDTSSTVRDEFRHHRPPAPGLVHRREPPPGRAVYAQALPPATATPPTTHTMALWM